MSLESVFANPPPLVGAEILQEPKSEDIEGCNTENKSTENVVEEEMKEDGEIEDGEIEDDGLDEEPINTDQNSKTEQSMPVTTEDKIGSEKEESEDEKKAKKRERKRLKRLRKKEKDREKKEEKKSKKRKRYVDHDNVDDELLTETWPPRHKRPSPSHYDSPYSSPRFGGSPYSSPTYGRKSPPGPYDSPDYESPPGPYDSPDEYDDMYDDGYEPHKKRSMMDIMGDGDIDSNVGAMEKEGMFQARMKGQGRSKGLMSASRLRKMEKRRKYLEIQRHMEERKQQDQPFCKFFMEGKCSKGEDCAFSHDFTPPKKPEVCKFYLSNACVKGNRCVYMHKEFPCKFFHGPTKSCSLGDSCKFSHSKLTAETQPILERILASDEAGFDIVGALERSAGKNSKKPSLLGSPPRHIKEQVEQALEQRKSIPSLLDLDVKPVLEAMSPARPQVRPKGFYQDTSVSPRNQQMSQQANQGLMLPPPQLMQVNQRVPVPLMQGAGIPKGFYGNFYGAPMESGMMNDQNQQAEVEEQDEKKPEMFVIPPNLPPKQRELFLRIQQQQLKRVEADNLQQSKQKADEDENWYSSDEEEGASKLEDVLKNITQQPPQQAPIQQQQQPAMDIMSMLSAIKNQTMIPANPAPIQPLMSAVVKPLMAPINQPVNMSQNVDTSSSDIASNLARLLNPRRQTAGPRKKVDPRVARFDPRLKTADNQLDENNMDDAQQAADGNRSEIEQTESNITQKEEIPDTPDSPPSDKVCLMDKPYKVHAFDLCPKPSYDLSLIERDPRLKNDPRLKRQLNKAGKQIKTTDPRKSDVKNITGSQKPDTKQNADRNVQKVASRRNSLQPSSATGSRSSSSESNPPSTQTTSKAEPPPVPEALKESFTKDSTNKKEDTTMDTKVDDKQTNSWKIPKTDTNSEENKATLSHRLDPRFKIKPKKKPGILTNNVPNDNTSEEPKKQTETVSYASPLATSHTQQDNVSQSYSTYNQTINTHNKSSVMKNDPRKQPNRVIEQQQNSVQINNRTDSCDSSSDELTIDEGPCDTNNESLKEVFSTIDPTASPFC